MEGFVSMAVAELDPEAKVAVKDLARLVITYKQMESALIRDGLEKRIDAFHNEIRTTYGDSASAIANKIHIECLVAKNI